MIDVFPPCYKLFSNDQPANPFGFLVCQFHMSLHMSNRLLVAFQPSSWKMNEFVLVNNECVCSSFIIGFISDNIINQTIWNNHLCSECTILNHLVCQITARIQTIHVTLPPASYHMGDVFTNNFTERCNYFQNRGSCTRAQVEDINTRPACH